MFVARVEELMEYSIDGLDHALAAAKLAREQAELDIAAITAVVQAKQAHVDHGHHSVNTYLKQQLNCWANEARTIRKRARLLNEHPAIADALSEGRVGVSQVDRLATAAAHPRAGHRFGEFAPILTDHAERLEHSEFLTAVKHFEMQADLDGAFGDQQFHEDERTASVSVNNGNAEPPESIDPTAGLCATTTGTPVHPDVALRAMVRGSIRRVLVDAHGVVIDFGRKQRLFTGAARHAARLLAVTCGHRGCDIPATVASTSSGPTAA